MSKKFNKHRPTWFAITTGPSADGKKAARYYVITCHRCGRQASYHATGLANDGLRKYFIRQKWDVGHSATQHVCPECINKPRLRVEEHPEPMHVVSDLLPSSAFDRLCSVWKDCNEKQQREFFGHAKYLI